MKSQVLDLPKHSILYVICITIVFLIYSINVYGLDNLSLHHSSRPVIQIKEVKKVSH